MVMVRGDINTWMQNGGGAALRSFDKTFNLNVTAYIRVYGRDNIYGGVMRAQNGPTSSANFGQRFEYVNASNSLLNNYFDQQINTGRLVYAQDIVDSIEVGVGRVVDLIEGRIGNRSISALLCHASCHSSCHTSRGRR